jgi:glutamyl-tRNA synthetase
MSGYFFEEPTKCEDEKAKAKYWTVQSPEHIGLVSKELEKISGEDFNTKNIEAAFMRVCENNEIKLGVLAQPVRLAISGVGAGPGLWEIMECIGRDECISRIEKAKQNF